MNELPLRARLSDDDFLDIDGPTGIALAPGDSREQFFLHLGMDKNNRRHQLIYGRMKSEAKSGMRRLYATRQSLRPEIINIGSIVPPYSVAQLSELAFAAQVEVIYQRASPQTRGIYDLVCTENGHWVIRWMLFRVLNARAPTLYRPPHTDHAPAARDLPALTSPTVTDVSLVTSKSPCTSIFSASNLRTSSISTTDGPPDWDLDTGKSNNPACHPPQSFPMPNTMHMQKSFWDHVL